MSGGLPILSLSWLKYDILNPENVISWIKGDDATFERDGSRVYSNLNDSGTLGGTWDAETNLHPVSTLVNVREVPQFGFNRQIQHSGPASAWDIFSNELNDVTLSIKFYPYSGGFTQTIMGNALSGTDYGLEIVQSVSNNDVVVYFYTGSGVAKSVNAGPISVNSWNTLQITKTSSGNVSVILDGYSVTDTIVTANGVPDDAMYIGGRSNGSEPFHGIISEVKIHNKVLDETELLQVRNYLSRWNATPDYSPLGDSADVACWYDGYHVDLTGASITTAYDESGHNNHITGTADEIENWVNGHGAIGGNGSGFLEIESFTQGALSQPTTHYVAYEHTDIGTACLFDGQSSNKQRLKRLAGTLALFAGSEVDSNIGSDNNLRTITRIVFNGDSSKARSKQSGEGEQANPTISGVGNNAINGLHLLAQYDDGPTNLFIGPIGEYIIFAGVAGDDVSANDNHHVELRDKYNIEAT